MKIAIVGAGVVGLSLANDLLNTHKTIQIDIYDSYSIPSKGTSIRNSGVLHAGLYYKPGSLKAKLCLQGSSLLQKYASDHDLPLLNCGKLLVPHEARDYKNIDNIKQTADQNGCETYLIDYKEAVKIQPNICRREKYLWSPKTAVFSPSNILSRLVTSIKDSGKCELLLSKIISLDPNNTSILTLGSSSRNYDFIFNVAGPGALTLFNQISSKLQHLQLIPFIGEYARLIKGPEIATNLYPVPDPELPFLGVHVTPQLNSLLPIIGPNALPFPRSYLDEYISSDLNDLPSRLSLLLGLYASNAGNFRSHANREFSLSKTKKFTNESARFFDASSGETLVCEMDQSVYGIRPQLVNQRTLNFVNDFLCERTSNIIHVVNAVSPAFTSSLALAPYLSNLMYS